uniref:Uncharacterized protein n=1 Tax=Arundo donax TaxID=35708 RepID=A0A0A8Z5U5_ARUDO
MLYLGVSPSQPRLHRCVPWYLTTIYCSMADAEKPFFLQEMHERVGQPSPVEGVR